MRVDQLHVCSSTSIAHGGGGLAGQRLIMIVHHSPRVIKMADIIDEVILTFAVFVKSKWR